MSDDIKIAKEIALYHKGLLGVSISGAASAIFLAVYGLITGRAIMPRPRGVSIYKSDDPTQFFIIIIVALVVACIFSWFAYGELKELKKLKKDK